MNLSKQAAKHFRQVYFGGNWSDSNVKDQLTSINWTYSNKKVGSLNTILALAYHLHYFVQGVTKVLEGGPLEIRDKFSFEHPTIQSESEWKTFLESMWTDAETFATLIERLPAEQMGETFVDEKYGSYFDNIYGIIEHVHYHLGQIAVIKKMILDSKR